MMHGQRNIKLWEVKFTNALQNPNSCLNTQHDSEFAATYCYHTEHESHCLTYKGLELAKILSKPQIIGLRENYNASRHENILPLLLLQQRNST